MTKKRQRVVIAMSGGVDSSVAAALLQRENYDVIGVTMEIFDGSTLNPEGSHHACFGPGEKQDIEDAARIAEKLGIPYRTVNLKQEYKKNILDFFVKEYQQGNTPNPCVKCNHEMKYGGIGRELEKKGIEFDYFATGHYAKVEYEEKYGMRVLKKARDQKKDQSYFLVNLDKEQLQKAIFPLGYMNKESVREIAKDLVPSVSEKIDSQDFVAGGYHQLFKEPGVPGPITDSLGKIIGQHKGIEFFTIGQRKGIGVSSKEPLYVTDKDAATNTLIVGPKAELLGKGLIATKLNWHLYDGLNSPVRLKAKIRFRHQEAEAIVTPLENGNVRVDFDEPQSSIAPGQTIVFYKDDIVAGGGIISREIK